MHAVTGAFKRWHASLPHIPRLTRYSLGEHINQLFIDLLEAIFEATFAGREEKLTPVRRASVKLDTLKLFLQLTWELKALDTKNFVAISTPLVEAGKMLGGWQKQITRKTPPV